MDKNRKELLMKSYCKLNSFQWCDGLYPKPADFDTLPCFNTEGKMERFSKQRTKRSLIGPIMKEIENELGEHGTSFAWWKYKLNRCYIHWLWWYYIEKHLPDKIQYIIYKIKKRMKCLQ